MVRFRLTLSPVATLVRGPRTRRHSLGHAVQEHIGIARHHLDLASYRIRSARLLSRRRIADEYFAVRFPRLACVLARGQDRELRSLRAIVSRRASPIGQESQESRTVLRLTEEIGGADRSGLPSRRRDECFRCAVEKAMPTRPYRLTLSPRLTKALPFLPSCPTRPENRFCSERHGGDGMTPPRHYLVGPRPICWAATDCGDAGPPWKGVPASHPTTLDAGDLCMSRRSLRRPRPWDICRQGDGSHRVHRGMFCDSE